MGWTWTMVMEIMITALTNLALLPALVVVLQQKRLLPFVFGAFTASCSFMYHLCGSINGTLWLTEGQWHRLDNIGCLSCFACLFVYLMANDNRNADRLITYTWIWVVLLLQEKAPWNIYFTLGPIFCFVMMPVTKWLVVRRERPPYRPVRLAKGVGYLGISFVCFFKGLDDAHDYLHLFHGGWHLFVGAAIYHLWQVVDEKDSRDRRRKRRDHIGHLL